MMDYILSPCAFAAEGLAGLLATSPQYLILLQPGTQEIMVLPDPAIVRRIVVYLPDDPLWLFTTLRQAAFLLGLGATPLPMLILSRCPIRWLWHTLLHLVPERGQLAQVWAAAADLPERCMTALLDGDALQAYPLLAQLAEKESLISSGTPGGLSKPELNAILDLLHGYNISERAKYRGVSEKTLYNQRTSGLKKMTEHYPQLAVNFPGNPVTKQHRVGSNTLSAFEREFVHAIHCRQVFPVFQPIIDDEHHLQGIEILSRWRRHGNTLPTSAFLPQIRAEYALLVLTAFMLQEAIQKINHYSGAFYFSISIPPAIASHRHLPRMMETERHQLHNPRWSERLVLEFAEITDFKGKGNVIANIVELQQDGFQIMLDDCFSPDSAIFPVMQAHFSGYKLNMSIINDMQRDPHALALIKSLIYYCQLTGSRCIAEGVDSVDKFTLLKESGVDHFQGNLISLPVDNNNLEDTIQQFLSNNNSDHAIAH